MSVWKVLFIVVFALTCLGLAFATVVVPTTRSLGDDRWVWGGGLLVATIVMGTLLTLFLRSADRAFKL